MGFKVFPAILWLSALTYTATSMPTFRADLTNGSYYIQPGSDITWYKALNDPGSDSCDMYGIIRMPFSSTTCYRVEFTFNANEPSGFNFHFSNGCGDGWGGSSGCYEVHNKARKVAVYPRTGSGGSTSSFPDFVTSDNDVEIQSGSVTVINGDGTEENVRHSTLFVPGNVFLSMNRVYDLTRYPNPLRVGAGLCSVRIYKC